MSELLLKAVVGKLESIESALLEIKEARPDSPDYTAPLENIKVEVEKVQCKLDKLQGNFQFPTAVIKGLSKQLEDFRERLQQPLLKAVVHHHYINKGILICVVLLVMVVICASWIFNLYQRMDDYRGNDIKYRYLRMHGNGALPISLERADSLY